MSSDLKGKKLLVLGANPESIPIIEIAKKMGVITYVTSNRPEDPAMLVADHPCSVDGMDVDGLIELVRSENIDGVMVGVADVLVPSYAYVCERLGLPCYASSKSVNVFAFKDNFKRTCESFGIHGIPEFKLDENLNREDLDKIVYPVMVKPVDAYSGLGMTVCYNESEIPGAVKKALTYSKKKRFIIERYMLCDDTAVYYTFKDGYYSVSCLFDRHTTSDQPGLARVNLGSTYPSLHTKDYIEKVHPKAIKMFESLGIRNGVFLMQAFYENGEFYVYDPGFRLQGEGCHLLTLAINGFDQREMLIRFALTGNEGDINLEKEDDVYFRGKSAATFWILLKSGKIGKIEGIDEIEKDSRCIFNFQRFHEGDEVQTDGVGTEKQVFTRLYLVCDSKEDLASTLLEYMDKIKVYDINGENMVLRGFDVNKALNLNHRRNV